MSLQTFAKHHDTELLVLASSFAVSYGISNWIVDNYYLLEYLFIILLFGLVQEAWSNLDPDEEKIELLRTLGADSKTGMQIGLLWFIGAAVYMSILLRDFVESFIGPLSVIQMLAVIVILSRGFVNVYISKNPFAVFDGQRDTYAAYTAGVTAFMLSWKLRDYYPIQSLNHNFAVIFLSIILPWLLYYRTGLGDNLPKLENERVDRRRRR